MDSRGSSIDSRYNPFVVDADHTAKSIFLLLIKIQYCSVVFNGILNLGKQIAQVSGNVSFFAKLSTHNKNGE
jgi:hypothetical protein